MLHFTCFDPTLFFYSYSANVFENLYKMKKYLVYSFIILLIGSCGNLQEKNPFPDRENLFNHGWEFVKDVKDVTVFLDGGLPWQQVKLTINNKPKRLA